MELADQRIVLRQGILAFVHGDLDFRLVVVVGRKNLRFTDRQRWVFWDSVTAIDLDARETGDKNEPKRSPGSSE